MEEFLGAASKLTAVRLRNNVTGEVEEMAADGAFLFVGQDPNTGFLEGSGVQLNPWGFIITGHDLVHNLAQTGQRLPGFHGREPSLLETSVPGIFAAGDVRAGSTKQVASAAGEGATAALAVREYLKTV